MEVVVLFMVVVGVVSELVGVLFFVSRGVVLSCVVRCWQCCLIAGVLYRMCVSSDLAVIKWARNMLYVVACG